VTRSVKGGSSVKFQDFKYVRPNIESIKTSMTEKLEEFKAAKSFEQQDNFLAEINTMRAEIDTMDNIGYIRHTMDTTDTFYEEEQNFWDENRPYLEELNSAFYKALTESIYRKELEEKWGSQLFTLAEMTLKVFSVEIIEDLQEENKLCTEYRKLMASAELMFDGQKRNLAQMQPFMQSQDRKIRKEAAQVHWSFFEENEAKFDDIYDKLVKVRHKIAQKLGFENFVEVAYLRMSRSDYNHNDVANYRKQVKESLVPITSELLKRQQKRLNLDALHYHDEQLEFTSGNATPKGEPEWILDQGKTMYQELSKETDEFFKVMTDKNLLDLVSREGKAPGGYCTYIADEKVPFIYSNFNGTSGDVDVLTHEAGHAFQVYSSRNFEVLEYNWPTTEACEIHSMSMEFFAWPWMNLFFKEDEAKYKFSHLSGGLIFIPYGVSVDEFQHFVYENPEATPEQRKAKWREIEKKYLPMRNYEEYPFLEKGTFWFKQMHIFEIPMYYIDYTLAQVCAYQFWVKSQNESSKTKAWNDYLKLCQAGGSVSFLKLIELANLDNPFENGSIAKVAGPIADYLNGVDDSKL